MDEQKKATVAVHKVILAEAFIKALTDAGLVPERTVSVFIKAKVGEPITMDYTCFGDERLLDVARGVRVAADGEDAGVAR